MELKIKNVQLGSDIEFFLQDRNTFEIVSAEGYAQGSKDNPFVFDNSSKFWATSLDNVAYEGNIPPVRTKADWFHNIERLRRHIDSTLPAHLCTIAMPAFEFDSKYLETDNARRFGCEPSYNCWLREMNQSPECDTNLRSTGFHIHASWDEMDMATIEDWIKTMDLFLGIPSVILEPENKRRTLYGKAGEFRFGKNMDRAEYRVLSGYFAGSKELIDYTHDNTQLAIDYINEGKFIEFDSALAKDIVKAINTTDKEIATKIIKELNIPILA